ncbi:armadillo-type protein [Powellomyces hirtus]|nr:armadillo-type protein [Powellomyces hirtus]
MAKRNKAPKSRKEPVPKEEDTMDLTPPDSPEVKNENMSEDDWEDVKVEKVKVEDDNDEEYESGDMEEGDDEIDGEEAGEDGQPPAKRARTAEEEEKIRQSRAEQKAMQLERKSQKPNAPLIQEAKGIWEKLRQKKLSPEEREVQMDALMDLIRGKVKDIIFKHDASRIIQCAIQYGNQKQKDEIASELKGHYAELSKSMYGRFIISKILGYCSKEYRGLVIKDFYGKITKLVRHKEASIILEEAYCQSNSAERSKLLEEFYGPEFALFKNAGGKTIEALITENPAKKTAIVKHLRTVLNSVLEKGFTNIGHLTIIHHAILEYMTFAEEKQMVDMIELLKEHLVTILHTREGARIAQLCILHAGPKDRKLIIKTLKGFVTKIAKEQYGHAVLISIFECVDDTVLVEKAIIGELTTDGLVPGEYFSDLMQDRFASRVLLYLLCGRDRKLQPAYLVDELEGMDAVRARTSKKDDTLRKEQLLKAISPFLIKTCTEKCGELVRDQTSGAVMVETIFHADGDKSELLQSLANLASGLPDDSAASPAKSSEPFNAVKKLKEDVALAKQQEEGIDMNEHVMLSRQATFVLKNIVSPRRKTDATETLPASLEFSTLLAEQLQPNVSYWLRHCADDPKRTSGTAFIFVALLERGSTEAKSTILKAIQADKALIKLLEERIAEKDLQVEEPAEAPKGKRKRNAKDNKKGGAAQSGFKILLRVFTEASV